MVLDAHVLLVKRTSPLLSWYMTLLTQDTFFVGLYTPVKLRALIIKIHLKKSDVKKSTDFLTVKLRGKNYEQFSLTG